LKVLVLRPSDYIARRIPLILHVNSLFSCKSPIFGADEQDSDTQLKTGMAELGGVSVRIRPERVGDRDGLKYAPRRERLKLYELSDRVDKILSTP